ncbi:MAG: hypothetical protein AMK71_02985 [Nitrospira bacterium SG8_35_4]|nr:MAG: hypothetical protein AMK71_02985 [Nitrospira bacterium SG8_35_4]
MKDIMSYLAGHKLHYHLERLLEWQQDRDVLPVYAEIGPTSLCNHRCLMCGYEHLGHKNQSLEYARMMELVDELHESGIKSLVFAGDGEPLINSATIPSIQRATHLGIDCGLSTNGFLLKDNQSSILSERLRWIRFSINGGNKKTYSLVHRTSEGAFNTVINNVRKLAQVKSERGHGITIGVQCVLLPENMGTISNLAAIVRESGADYFVVKPFYPVEKISYKPGDIHNDAIESLRQRLADLADDNFSADIRLRELKSNSGKRVYVKCYGIDFIVIVTSSGDVYSCLPQIGDERFKFGNIYENGFSEIWSGERKKAVMDFIDSFNKDTCQPNCRNHRINEFLWDLKHPHLHKNFI